MDVLSGLYLDKIYNVEIHNNQHRYNLYVTPKRIKIFNVQPNSIYLQQMYCRIQGILFR